MAIRVLNHIKHNNEQPELASHVYPISVSRENIQERGDETRSS